MATDFHEVQFPTDISVGSAGGPQFNTEVVELSSGHEQRAQNWTYPRERWNVAYGVKSETLLDTLLEFFYVRAGRAIGFRFKNPSDYNAVGESIGTGDGVETEFQLTKQYSSGGETLLRKISKPVVGTIDVYIDSVVQGSTVTVDTTTGLVTFDTAPLEAEAITADFEFDVPVRFDTDHLPVSWDSYQARSVDVPIVEIRI